MTLIGNGAVWPEYFRFVMLSGARVPQSGMRASRSIPGMYILAMQFQGVLFEAFRSEAVIFSE